VLTHPQILLAVWGLGCLQKTNCLHVYITHLREKIETFPSKPEILVTEARVGYRFNLCTPRDTARPCRQKCEDHSRRGKHAKAAGIALKRLSRRSLQPAAKSSPA
jgi:DNA-binding winged helix-turn-helix (wHTH) protein